MCQPINKRQLEINNAQNLNLVTCTTSLVNKTVIVTDISGIDSRPHFWKFHKRRGRIITLWTQNTMVVAWNYNMDIPIYLY